ncbi:hypothetical protein LZ32DRAFT_53485 [Colletotrichum eremochloae]|nr:hypothetical protein LZ32DRAFT_53485 [Colletotrichum eremochloae]
MPFGSSMCRPRGPDQARWTDEQQANGGPADAQAEAHTMQLHATTKHWLHHFDAGIRMLSQDPVASTAVIVSLPPPSRICTNYGCARTKEGRKKVRRNLSVIESSSQTTATYLTAMPGAVRRPIRGQGRHAYPSKKGIGSARKDQGSDDCARSGGERVAAAGARVAVSGTLTSPILPLDHVDQLID